MFQTILTEERDGAFIITLNRPEARNAMSVQMQEEVTQALEYWDANPALRACVFTNTGSVFCAGADLKEISAGTWSRPHGLDEQGHPIDYGFAGMTKRYFKKPIIAAVNGKCLGGGLEMVLACDLAVAAEGAIFGLPEPRVGLTASGGGALLRIGQQIPTKLANQILLLAEPISAGQALEWGLINDVVPADRVLDRAIEFAQTIARSAPLAIEMSKRVVYETFGQSPIYPNEGWRMLEEAESVTYNSQDAHEGSTAFAEKRAPQWKGC